ncbi:MAG: type II toxin-antitoxin system RelE/ParE family toxin [Bryobacteraceae bacterium]
MGSRRQSPPANPRTAFKVLYHQDALADLEEIFDWSREKHPETTEQFANDLFDHIELLRALPYVGTPMKGHPQLRRLLHSPLYVYYRINENREAIEILHFWHSSRKEPGF